MLGSMSSLRLDRLDRVARSAPLTDEAIDRYVDWREQSLTVQALYDRWASAASSEHSERFAAYAAALDREERAAQRYASSIIRLRQSLWPDA